MAVQKMRIKLKAYDHNLVDQSAARIVETVKKSGAKYSGPIPMPTEKEVITILRAVHKYKDSREQFEMRTYKRLIDIYNPSAKVVDSLMKIELPAGVDILSVRAVDAVSPAAIVPRSTPVISSLVTR